MAISTDHYLDLEDGKFSRTTRNDLAQLFQAVEADPNADHLIVHFHGGLVSRDASMAMAERLLTKYRETNAYPAFFVWNSDLYSTFKNNLAQVFSEIVFERMVQILSNFLVGKLVDVSGGRSDGQLSLDSMRDYDLPLEDLRQVIEAGEEEFERPTTWADPDASAGDLELNDEQVRQLEHKLAEDPEMQRQMAAISAGIREKSPGEQDLGTRGAGVSAGGSTSTLISADVLNEIGEEAEDTRSIALGWVLARNGAAIARNVLRRYWHGRDHGLYTTIVEEVLRRLYLDNLGQFTWSLIKDDTQDAFAGNAEIHGGTAFVEHLTDWWRPGRRLTLVGHSTGAIYIGHFLQSMDEALPPEAKADVIFLAPACTFEFLHRRLDLFRRRVARLRSFGLTDDIESGYWEVPGYRGSLLYMVSGLAEGDAEQSLDKLDMPLLGMQRYFDQTEIYQMSAVANVRAYVGDEAVWSVADGGSGRRSAARKHGDFDDDELTMQSVVEFISQSV